jgi:hypothetical protein
MVPDACPGPDPGFVGTMSGCRIKSGMTDQAVYGQTLLIYFLRIYLKEGVSIGPVDPGESGGIRRSVDSQLLYDVHAG